MALPFKRLTTSQLLNTLNTNTEGLGQSSLICLGELITTRKTCVCVSVSDRREDQLTGKSSIQLDLMEESLFYSELVPYFR